MNPLQHHQNIHKIFNYPKFNTTDDAIAHYKTQSLPSGLGPSFLVKSSHNYLILQNIFVHPDGNVVANGSHSFSPWALQDARAAAIMYIGEQANTVLRYNL